MQEKFSHFLTGGGTLFGYTTDLNLAPTSAVRLTSSILTRSHCDFSMQLTLKPVFFNRGSAEPNGSASGIQGFRRTVGAQQKKIKLRPTFAATRRVFWALSMYLWSGLCTTGAYSTPPDPLAGGERARCSPRASGVPLKDMGSMNNQNCCKGFRFTEKVERHWLNF